MFSFTKCIFKKSKRADKTKGPLIFIKQDKFKADEGSKFKMFDSSAYSGKDLMFKDSTVGLYNVDAGSYTDYLGQDYVNTVKGTLLAIPINCIFSVYNKKVFLRETAQGKLLVA